jgi:phosphohistidine swiveling domain-containing protein
MTSLLSTIPAPPAQTNEKLVLDLSAVNAAMLPQVGGKAANLGEMIRAGLPVPPGVCVTTRSYALVADSVAIDFAALDTTPPERIAPRARRIRESILEAPVPAMVAEAIGEAYHSIGGHTPVAVRSSATAEDLPHASFAGQQDTYLHIIGAAAVLGSVRRCWASLWTDRATVYRAKNGIDHRAVRLAVVIQKMVDAEVAGVLFTANPVTGRRRQAVIDASPGLGEAVVSGAVNPDHFVVDTATGDILERRIGDKRFVVRSLPEGGTHLVERHASAEHACIPDEQVRAVAALGDHVEAYYRAPQDTEWAIDSDGKLWLTQARPITTLFPLPEGSSAEDYRVYFCFSLAQGLYRPLTPMGLAAFRVVASAAARQMGIHVDDPMSGPPVYAEAGQRVFVDLTGVLLGHVGRQLMPRVLDAMEANSAIVLRSLLDDPRLSVNRRSAMLFIRRVLSLACRFGIPLRVVESVVSPAAAHQRAARVGRELRQRLSLPTAATPRQRLDFVERVLTTEIVPLIPKTMPGCAAGFALLGLAGVLLGSDAQPEELQAVLRGVPHNVTTEMDLALWDLASRIAKNGPFAKALRDRPVEESAHLYQRGDLPRIVQQGLEEFLARYGHRAVAEIDVGVPRWSDDPAHIIGVLANYLRISDPESGPSAIFRKGAAAAERMVEELSQRARRRGRLRGWLVRFALRRARQLVGLRELGKYYAIVCLAAVRGELAKVGEGLTRRGLLDTADDVFYLDLREARAAEAGRDSRALVRERHQAYETELRRRRVPRVLLSDGTEPEARMQTAGSTDALSGTPASAGKVTGIARVILDPVGARLEPGEILVAPSTDPGWTPLFLTAGGLVMEMGGANSHGAVVAREYGIPAVVGVGDATTRIRSGQSITLDGAAGTITCRRAG